MGTRCDLNVEVCAMYALGQKVKSDGHPITACSLEGMSGARRAICEAGWNGGNQIVLQQPFCPINGQNKMAARGMR
jgi:hypothetical protein